MLVFAEYSLAMYLAQCLEIGLVNLLVAPKLKNRDKIIQKSIKTKELGRN